MPDKFTAICPKCGKKKQVLLKHAGRQAECKCGARFRLEEAVAYSAAQEEEARKQVLLRHAGRQAASPVPTVSPVPTRRFRFVDTHALEASPVPTASPVPSINPRNQQRVSPSIRFASQAVNSLCRGLNDLRDWFQGLSKKKKCFTVFIAMLLISPFIPTEKMDWDGALRMDRKNEELRLWDGFQPEDIMTIYTYERFIQKHPKSRHVEFARNRVAKLKAGQRFWDEEREREEHREADHAPQQRSFLQAETAADVDRDVIGSWYDVAIGRQITIVHDNGNIYGEESFSDGSSRKSELTEKSSSLGRRFDKASGSRFGDHWIITAGGGLQIRDSQGLTATLQ